VKQIFNGDAVGTAFGEERGEPGMNREQLVGEPDACVRMPPQTTIRWREPSVSTQP